jgi:hypothetical protein
MGLKQILIACVGIFNTANVVAQSGYNIESIGITNIIILEVSPFDDMFAGSPDQGVVWYNNSGGVFNFSTSQTADYVIQSDSITAILLTPVIGNGTHAVIGMDKGLFISNSGSHPSKPAALLNKYVKGICLRPDSIYVTTDDSLYKIDSTLAVVSRFNLPFSKTTSIVSINNTSCMGFWAGTEENGCFFTYDGSSYTYIDTSVANQNLVNNHVNDIETSSNCDTIYVGTQGGFSVCVVGEQCQNYTISNGLPQNEITEVEIGNNNEIWLGTQDSGIVIFNKVSQTFTTRLTSDNGIADNHISALDINSRKKTYIGSPVGKVTLVDSNKNVIKILNSISENNQNKFAVNFYPNPSSTQLNFSFLQQIKHGEIKITDMSGREIKGVEINNSNGITIDITSLNIGMYFYYLFDENKLKSKGKIDIIR